MSYRLQRAPRRHNSADMIHCIQKWPTREHINARCFGYTDRTCTVHGFETDEQKRKRMILFKPGLTQTSWPQMKRNLNTPF